MEGVVDHVTKINTISFFEFFLKLSLLYHISFLVDVLNLSFWKLYIKTLNDFDSGLNVLELFKVCLN